MHRAISTIAAIAFFLAATASPPPAFAEEARDVFDSLYGPKLKQVSATLDRADDVALAKEMVATANASGSTPGLQALLCDAAYELGNKHPDGYGAAAEAMQVLSDSQEAKRGEAREKLLLVLTKQSRVGKAEDRNAASDALIDLLVTMGDAKAEKKQYSDAAADYRRAFVTAQQRKSESADAVKAKLEWALGRERVLKQIERLQAKLLADAKDFATAEAIVKLYVVDLNDPKSAEPYLERSKDDRLKKLVPLATVPIDRLDEQQCLELGELYHSFAVEAEDSSTGLPLFIRARLLLERYRKLHPAADLGGVKAETLLVQVHASIRKIGLPARTLAYFSFDKATVKTRDSDVYFDDISGSGSVARNFGAKVFDAGKIGACVQFDGGYIEVSIKNFPEQIRELTVAAWIRPEVLRNHTVVDNHDWPGDKPRGFVLRVPEGTPDFSAGGEGWIRARGENLRMGEWVFLAGVIEQNTIRLFVDGEEVAKQPIKGPVIAGPQLYIGKGYFKDAAKRSFQGLIDEVMIIGRALSAKEIKALADW